MFGNMLILHSINPTGMFSYGKSEDITIRNNGLVHLVGINEDKGGDSNGSGKSSFFNALCEILFQENPTGEKADAIINSVWDRGFAGRVMFTNWEGVHYRITYCRKWKGQLYPVDNDNKIQYVGTGLFLDKFEDKVWRDCRGSGMPDTHLKILKVVGMSYQQFMSIAYMNHRVGSQFLRGTNKERMDILSGITGIEEWDKILDKCRGEKKILNAKIANIDQRVSFERGSVQTLQEQLQSHKAFDWTSHIKSLEENLGSCREKYAVVQGKINELNVEIEKLQAVRDQSYNKEKVDAINADINELNLQLRTYEIELSGSFYPVENAALRQAFSEAQSALGQAQGELRATQGSSGSILEMTICPTCESKITKVKKEKISKKIKQLQEDIQELDIKRTDIQTSMEKDKKVQLEVDQEEKQKVQKDLAKIRIAVQTKIKEIQDEQASYSSYESQIQVLRNGLPNLQAELNLIHSQGSQINSQIEQAHTSVATIKTLEEQINEKQRQVQFFENEIAEVQVELQVYLWLIDNIPYIKLHKMSISMVEISELCNQYFDEMGDTIRINIKSFEEKARKKHAADIKDLMKSEVKVEITDGAKKIPPKLYSDGEISKISLAVIRALHEMARKSGKGCNVMLMDEVFSFVDGGNSQKISNSIANFINKGTVFLTDNSGSVNNLINFDHVWVARKKNGQTLLELDQ